MSGTNRTAFRRIDYIRIFKMSPYLKRVMGALVLVSIALPSTSYAASSAPPPPPVPPIAVEDAGTPGDKSSNKPANEIPEYPVSPFPMKNKLACFAPPPAKYGYGDGWILFENMGPGTLTVGETIKITILPGGRVLSYVLPYDIPPHSGIFLKAYPAGEAGVSCTFTATPHPGPRVGAPHP
jgi:hypothetical protein